MGEIKKQKYYVWYTVIVMNMNIIMLKLYVYKSL